MRDPTGAAKPPAGADSPAAQPARGLQLIGGSPFEITLAEDVPADSKPGQLLHFKAAKAITVDGTVVIAAGAPVTGAVVETARKKFLIHTTRPTFRLLEATAVDGSQVKVRATPGHLGESRKDPPLDPIGGTKSKDAVAPAGSHFMAYIDGDQTLAVRK